MSDNALLIVLVAIGAVVACTAFISCAASSAAETKQKERTKRTAIAYGFEQLPVMEHTTASDPVWVKPRA